jgi:small subunit ribosomal protein S15
LKRPHKGTSQSIRPVTKRPPAWCRYKPEEVEAIIVKLSKEGHSPSKIGTILRDQYGIPLVKPIVGKRITHVLKDSGVVPPTPEDLDVLLRKAASLRVHLEKNRKDVHNKRAMQLTEARIHKLARYYKSASRLPPEWKYTPKTVSAS